MQSSKLDNLKKKQEQLKSQIQRLENLEKTRERKRDTRRKILVGSCFLEEAKNNNELEKLCTKMHEYLTRERDKELFKK